MDNLLKNRRLIIVSAIMFIFWIFFGFYFIYLGYQTNLVVKENNEILKHLESTLIISFEDKERRLEFVEEVDENDNNSKLEDFFMNYEQQFEDNYESIII